MDKSSPCGAAHVVAVPMHEAYRGGVLKRAPPVPWKATSPWRCRGEILENISGALAWRARRGRWSRGGHKISTDALGTSGLSSIRLKHVRQTSMGSFSRSADLLTGDPRKLALLENRLKNPQAVHGRY